MPTPLLNLDWCLPNEHGSWSSLRDGLQALDRPLYVARRGDALVATFASPSRGEICGGALPVVGFCPPLRPDALGDPSFLRDHGTRNTYVGGAMANGIASVELTEALARARMLAIFGAAGLSLPRVEQAIDALAPAVAEGLPIGFNLIHSPAEPALEQGLVDLYLRRGVRTISASAYLGLTLSVVRMRVTGIAEDASGRVVAPNRFLAKVSREEVARLFLSPPPRAMLDELVERGAITTEQAGLAARIPMADDVTVEADSGGHTDNRPLMVMLPRIQALRDSIAADHGYARAPRIGAAGGLGSPAAIAGAYAMGAAYVVIGSVHQACRESGSSDRVRELLAQAGPTDVAMAPAADMFEMGVKVQVLSRGTLFPVRARKLYGLYSAYPSLDALPVSDRNKLETTWFRASLEQAWADCERFWRARDPTQLERASRDPKHQMALLFRGYLGLSSRWANAGDPSRVADYQIWCGPAMGSFNAWAQGTWLEDWRNRTVVAVADNLMAGAALATRASMLRAQGVKLPPGAARWEPRRPEALTRVWSVEENDADRDGEPAPEPSVRPKTGGGSPEPSDRAKTGDGSPEPSARPKTGGGSPEPIAIVGMACLFPQAPDPAAFWRNIRLGVDAITELPEGRGYWSVEDLYDPDPKARDKVYAHRGGFLDPVDFDPTEFGFPPALLEATDTSQLLGVWVAARALENAGYGPGVRWDRSRASVVLGVTGTQELVIPLGARLGHGHWRRALAEAGVDAQTAEDVVERISSSYVEWQEGSFPGLLGNVVAGRIANRLDLGGTNCVIDAACASSLGAIGLALHELRSGQADLVLSGGVDTLNDAFMYACFSKTPALSKTGRVRPLDRGADGTILGEGIAILVLKRLSDAERDGDRIRSVIRSVGSSSDGRGKSIYAPRASGQVRAIRAALAGAGVEPDAIDLVEAHATGTTVGDRVELEGLQTVFGGREQPGTIAVGSVKSQIGHTKAAAGAAGLMKVALALEHKVLPPTINVEQPIDILRDRTLAFYLSRDARPWIAARGQPRRAGVSAFGFGGSNFHAIVEEYPRHDDAPHWDGAVEILAWSGADEDTIASAVAAASASLRSADHARARWARVQAIGRSSRASFSAADPARLTLVLSFDDDPVLQLSRALEALRHGAAQPGIFVGRGEARGGVALLFAGQGTQRVRMGAELACVFPAARRAWEAIPDIAAIAHPPSRFDSEELAAQQTALTRTDRAQPALGALGEGLLAILRSFGVEADAVAGHSYGELVALRAAGVLDAAGLREASRVRGALMSGNGDDRGTMLAVLAPLAEVEALVADPTLELTLANRNAPSQGVVAGTRAAIEKAAAACRARGLKAVPLAVGAGFHSPCVAGSVKPLLEALEDIELSPPAVPIYANTTAEPYPRDPALARRLLAEQLTRPVDWLGSIEAMYDRGIRSFVEVGPSSMLSQLVARILDDRPHAAIATLTPGSELRTLARALAALAAEGRAVRLRAWQAPSAPVRAGTSEPRPRRMSVPIGGANYRAPSPRKPPRPTTSSTAPSTEDAASRQAGRTPLPAPPPARRQPPVQPRVPPLPAVSAPRVSRMSNSQDDPSALAQALAASREHLAALQSLHERTAAVHERFLDGQRTALTSFHSVLAGQQQLVELALTGGTSVVTTTSSPSAPSPSIDTGPAPSSAAPPVLPSASRSLATAPVPSSPSVPDPAPSAPSPRPTAPSAQEPAAPSKALDQGHGIVPTMLALVATITGYPSEMLELDMDLESDLGIDSIKRVEILSQLSAQVPGAPAVEPDRLGSLRTLRQIAELVEGGRVDAAPPPEITATAPAPAARDAEPVSSDDDEAILFGVIADVTGYPTEMLELGMDLESDLGIDSIKRVEILSLLGTRIPGAPQVDPEQLGNIRTLEQVLRFVRPPPRAEATGEGVDRLPFVREEAPLDSGVSSTPAARTRPTTRTLATISLPAATEGAWPIAQGREIWIIDDASPLADALHARIEASSSHRVRRLGADACVTARDPEALASVGGLIVLGEHPSPEDARAAIMTAFAVLRAAWTTLGAIDDGAFLLTVARDDGAFGLARPEASPTTTLQSALTGLAKTAAREAENLWVRALDIDREWSDPEEVAAAVLAELSTGGPREVGIGARGRVAVEHVRLAPADETRPPAPRLAPSEGIETPPECVVITGGARGVTAACAIALAEAGVRAFLLLGRSAAPEAEPPWLSEASELADVQRALLAHRFTDERPTPKRLRREAARVMAQREIRRTRTRLEAKGARVIYAQADVRDAAALARAIEDAEARLGPVTGALHGAGVLRDRLIADKTDEDVDVVLGTKVDGALALLKALADRSDGARPLRWLGLFTSVTGRFGRRGQSDYAAANAVLDRLAGSLAAQKPDTRVVAFAWGPWAGGMVTPALRRTFEREGVGLIDLAEGASLCAEELLAAPDRPSRLVIGDGLDAGPASRSSMRVDLCQLRYLDDHRLAGKPVLPFSFAIETMARAAVQAHGLPLREISEAQVLAGVSLQDGPLTLTVHLGRGRTHVDGTRCEVELRDPHDRPRFRCTVRMSDAEPHEGTTVPELPDLQPLPGGMRRAYSEQLFHGPSLAVIESMQLSDAGLRARLHGGAGPSALIAGEPPPRWSLDPVVLDAVFQTMVVWCRERQGIPALPSRVARLELYAPIETGEPLRLELRIKRQRGASVLSEVSIVGADDSLRMRAEGCLSVMSEGLVAAMEPPQRRARGSARPVARGPA